KDCIDWFQQKYGRKIAQSTVSESLGDSFKHLDDTESPSSVAYRQRQALWPILKAILFSWQQKIEHRGGLLSGDILIKKAREIWVLIPEYTGQPIPNFSLGWLDKFKRRHGL
ncbi:CenpB-DNA-bind-domain-containing protein, partial [Zopfia rhizophila CBS 207.26]